MQENFELLQSNDVVEIKELEDKAIKDLINAMDISYLFKVGDFIESLADPKNLLKEGISCRVMTTRKNGWIEGKIKLSLQFIPDEISTLKEERKPPISFDSPLDEIRNTSTSTEL